jgi:hypothetical protein
MSFDPKTGGPRVLTDLRLGAMEQIGEVLRNHYPDAAPKATERTEPQAASTTNNALAQALYEATAYGIGATSDANQKIILQAAKELAAHRTAPQAAVDDPLANLVDRFSKALLAKLRLAQANGRSGWELDDWEKQCQEGLLHHVEKGDPRDVAAYCAFMWHHGWVTKSAQPQGARSLLERAAKFIADSGCDEDDNEVNVDRDSLLREIDIVLSRPK